MNQKFTNFIKLFLLALILISPLNDAKAVSYQNPKAVEALSKCLAAQDAIMYGTANCGHCKKQKEMFEPYFRNISFVDCRANSAAAKACNVAKVGKFPQWNFTNGKKIVREVGLDEIAQASDCDIFVSKALGDDYSEPVVSETKYQDKSPSNNVKKASEENNNDFSNSVYGSSAELAKCLKSKGVKFYGSPKCSHCNKQKEMFEGNFEKYLSSNFHNCKGSSAERAECNKNNTFPFPTWREPSTGKKLLGPEKSLNQIAQTFDCTLEEREMTSQDNNDSSQSLKAMNMNDEQEEAKVFSKPANYENNQTKANLNTNANNSYTQQEKIFLAKKQDKLAQCLINRNIILYGIIGESKSKPIQQKATMQQLGELGNASKKVKIVDCSLGQAECNGILVYPTWILEDKRELAGVYELDNLAQILNCQVE